MIKQYKNGFHLGISIFHNPHGGKKIIFAFLNKKKKTNLSIFFKV